MLPKSTQVRIVERALQEAGAPWSQHHFQVISLGNGLSAIGLGSKLKARERGARLALALTVRHNARYIGCHKVNAEPILDSILDKSLPRAHKLLHQAAD